MKKSILSKKYFFLSLLTILLFFSCNQKCNCSDPVPVTKTNTTVTTKTLIADTINYDATSIYGKVSSFYPTTTYPTVYCLQANVWTKNGNPLTTRAYFTMNLSSLPTDTSQIKSAIMVLHSNFDSSDPYYGGPSPEGEVTSNSFYISRVTSSWNPATTLTWNNQPIVSATDFVIVPGNSSDSAVYVSNVTSIVKNAIANGQSTYGFQLRLLDETTEYNSINIFMGNSKPADRIYAEKLAVQYYK